MAKNHEGVKWNASPLAFNFKNYRNYHKHFSHADITIFEQMILSVVFFNSNPFYKTLADLSADTRLKRHTIEKSLGKFVKLGYVSIHPQPKPKPTIFHINFDVICANLDEIYVTAENNSLIADFYNSIAEIYNNSNSNRDNDINTTKKAIADVSLSPKKFEEAKSIIKKMEKIYNDRRRIRNDSKKYDNILPETSLPFDKISAKLAYECNELKGFVAVENSFMAFSDEVATGVIKPGDPLKYFFMQDDNGFPVVDAYLSHFNLRYSKQK